MASMKHRSAASSLVKSHIQVELNSTGSYVDLGLATLMQVAGGRGTFKWLRLREIHHKTDRQ